MRNLIYAFVIVLVLCPFAHGEIYKCVDKDGNITFTSSGGPGCEILGDKGFEEVKGEGTVQPSETTQEKKTTEQTEPGENSDLKVLSFSWAASYGFVTAEGEVKNESPKELIQVTALVKWYDNKGNLITSESSPIETDPLPPTQTAPFKVTSKHDSAITSATVEFKFSVVEDVVK